MFFYEPRRFFTACSLSSTLTSFACFALALCGAQPVAAQSFSNMVFFGDSNTDNGIYAGLRAIAQANPAIAKQFSGQLPSALTGIYTTSPGLMWSEALGRKFGIAITPASGALAGFVAAPYGVQLSGVVDGGNMYAAGGARVVYRDPTTPFVWSATDQVSTYLASTGGKADPNALYTVLIGTNDLNRDTKGGPGNIVSPVNASQLNLLAQQASDLSVRLKNAGARYILVPNLYNAGATPDSAKAAGVTYNATYVQSRADYSQGIWKNLSSSNVNVIPADFSSMLSYVLTHPSSFGFSNTKLNEPACGSVGAFSCFQKDWVSPNANVTYVFADTFGHLSSGGQQIEADYVYNLLAAPGQISLMPVAQLRGRLGVIEAIRAHMPDKARVEGERHAWISGDVAALKSGVLLDAQPGKTLRPMSVAAGVDYQISPLWLAGFGASFGRSNQSFATGGGFHSDDVAASLYLGFRQEALWMNAVVTAGRTNVSISRSVTLGITTETNSASPRGSGQSLALQGGYDFAATLSGLPVTHGPVLGLIAQRARLDGFTEANGQSGLTALQFASQSRGSTIAELGYQGSLDLGGWKLFSKLVWSHELQTAEKTINTALTTIAAPAYALPAAALPKNCATASAGAKYAITDKLSGYVSASLRSGGGGSGGFGASVGLNLAF